MHLVFPIFPIIQAAREVVQKLTSAGFKAYFAGGCVRDILLGRAIKDIDIATSATPGSVESVFCGKTVAVGKSFGVILVQHAGFSFDVATFRSDGAYADGRHPQGVTFTTAQEDAQRRDFTVNGLFYDPQTETVIDHVHGLDDLAQRVIRAIGCPEARFCEDGLRILRAIRFATVLGFSIDPATRRALEAQAERICAVSEERIASEFLRMLMESERPSEALELLHTCGVLQIIMPELEALRGTRQPPKYHPEGDVWVHTALMLDELAYQRREGGLLADVLTGVDDWTDLFVGVLLHDIGKPQAYCETLEPEGGLRIRFPNHAPIGAKIAEALLRRFKQPLARIERVAGLVSQHMTFVDVEQMREAKLRRFLGHPDIRLMLALIWLDIRFSNNDFTAWNFLHQKFLAFKQEPILPEARIRGRDLLALGFQPGPELGQILTALYDAQLEGRLDEAWAALQKTGKSISWN
jgi:poly(A) polymerase